MKKELDYYSVGQASKLCRISTNTLRFYDKIGLIHPDKLGENNYRFYSKEALAYIPVIKYYKQMGFSLEEIKEIIDENSFVRHEKLFKEKTGKLKDLKKEIYLKYASIEGWLQLITEADLIRKNQVSQVSLKYLESSSYCWLDQPFINYREAIVNIEFSNYMESIGHQVAGFLLFHFPDNKRRLKGEKTQLTIMQQPILKVNDPSILRSVGGNIYASCYHLGPFEQIHETYDKIFQWAKANDYTCDEDSYERSLIDYWTTQNTSLFVSEVLVRVEKNSYSR